jgi:hypothetical protein
VNAPKTASQRGAANRRRGHTAERDLAKWLRANGFPHAERAVKTGFRTTDRTIPDPGDITGTLGIVWSVKDCAVERLEPWLSELDAMDDRANPTGMAEEPIRLLVVKRRGHADPARWWCYLRVYQLARVLDDAETCFVFGVRAELQEIVMTLHAAGYGDVEETA